ncbi:MAG: acyl-CoA dehydrogenase family protein [Candidatus Njordarchaeia archaeon]
MQHAILEKISWDKVDSIEKRFLPVLKEEAGKVDEINKYTDNLIKAINENKLLLLTVEENLGGLNSNFPTTITILRLIARELPALSLSLSTHIQVLNYLKNINPDLYKEVVENIVKNGSFLAVAITEPAAGTDIKKIETKIVDKGDKVVVSGLKSVVTNGLYANYYLLLVKDSDNQFALALVPRGNNVEELETVNMIGTRGAGITKTRFNDVEIPKNHVLESGKIVYRSLFNMLSQGRLSTAAMALGIVDSALESIFEWGNTREVLGKKLIEYDHVKQRVGEIASTAETLWLHILITAMEADEDKDISYDASMAKQATTDLAIKAANFALTLYGSHGFVKNSKLDRLYRDAKSTEFIEGSNEALRSYIHGILMRRFGKQNLLRFNKDDF